MNYSMIALDVDGTLLNDRHEITEITKKALLQAHANGTTLVLCTGRGPGNAVPILEQLELEGVLITHNGAATIQTPGPVLLHEYGFSVTELESLIHYCRQNSVHFDVHTAFDLYMEQAGTEEADMYEKFMLQPERIGDVLQLNQAMVKFTMFGQSQRLDEIERELPGLSLSLGLQWIRSGDQFIDVMSGQASKAKALEQLATQWGIPPERIMAIGNYYNDVEMLQFAGLGIAMDNSPEPVKKAADDVTLSNNDHGVYKALVKYGVVDTIDG
jgi:Cof subfamily protein (haloacid dehalogenase superfamily)